MPLKDPEGRRAYAKVYREKNAVALKAKKQAYHRKNAARICLKSRVWYAENRERARARKRLYTKKHSARILAKVRAWQQAHPEQFLLNMRMGVEQRRARKLAAPINDFTREQWEEMKVHYKNRCVYCGKKFQRLTMDHITPLSKGGSHTKANIVPACRSCNARKNAGAPLVPVQPLLL